MKRTHVISWICCLSAISALTYAEEQAADIVVEKPAEQTQQLSVEAANADAQVVLTVHDQVQAIFDEFIQKRSIRAYGARDERGICYYADSDIVSCGPENPEFIPKRATAFTRAYNKAVMQHIKYMTGVMASTTVDKLVDNSSSDVLDTPQELADAMTGITKKLAVLSEAKIDEELVKLGIDPNKYKGKPLEVKRTTYLSELVKTSATRAIGSSAGLAVVKTFEARTPDNTYAIGVILKFDPAFAEIASCMSKKIRPVVAPKPGLPVDALIGKDPAILLQNFGTRLFYDEKGEPALLSFGQWASTFSGNDPRRKARKQDVALLQAEELANQALNEYITGSVSYENASETGEVLEEANIFDENGTFREGNVNKLLSKLQTKFRNVASDTLAGRKIVYKKILKHPAGHEVAVVAVSWSFSQLDAVRNTPPPPPAAAKPVTVPGDAGVREGDEYDF
ncbi:MAG: hypothetical protein J6334_03420 [Kiritimatiellae bacterium]|nr:hypothetical protein [Kiritimatiellia bacterium]